MGPLREPYLVLLSELMKVLLADPMRVLLMSVPLVEPM